MPYNKRQIAKELTATALGEVYCGNALYVSLELPETTHNDRAMLNRWLHGTQTTEDVRDLQRFAILLAEKGD